MAESLNTSFKIIALDAFTKPVANMRQSMVGLKSTVQSLRNVNVSGIGDSMRGIGTSAGVLRSSLMSMRSVMSGLFLGSAGAFGFKRLLLDPAMQFEEMTAQLEAIQGSSDKAKESMKWVRQFAIDTPFDIKETTGAFTDLLIRGINPTTGALNAFGEAATALKSKGETLSSVTDAIMGVFKGRPQGLARLGITAHKEGEKMFIAYQNKKGEKLLRSADANNKQGVADMIAAALGEKYAGAMAKFNATMAGLFDNVGDVWGEFAQGIMDAGLFDFLKKELGGMLAWVERAKANGDLKKWAAQISDGFTGLFTGIKVAGPIVLSILGSIGSTLAWITGDATRFKLVLLAIGAFKGLQLGLALNGMRKEILGLSAGVLGVTRDIAVALIPELGLLNRTQLKSLAGLRAALKMVAMAAWTALAPIAAITGSLILGWKLGSLLNEKVIDPLSQARREDAEEKRKLAKGTGGFVPDLSPLSPDMAPLSPFASGLSPAKQAARRQPLYETGPGTAQRNLARSMEQTMAGDLTIRIESDKPVSVQRLRTTDNFDINVTSLLSGLAMGGL